MYPQSSPFGGSEWYSDIMMFVGPILIILLILIIVATIFSKRKPDFHSHWNTLISNFKYSSIDFYKQLANEMNSHQIEGMKFSKVNLNEGGTFSSRRTYLRVEWKKYQYDMCCAPFGDGLFLSSWLMIKTSSWQIFVSRIPFIGKWLERKFFTVTYYKIDTASMFMTYCHDAMLKVADDITKDSGTRINENERKPVLKDIFKR